MPSPDQLGGATATSAAALSALAREAEVARVLQICNACRYCEGYCAVFPAMTRRLEFGTADVHYLANLCHNCGDCLHACQYAPPHEFAVNVPWAMARVRVQTYADYAWPQAFAGLYRRNGLTLALARQRFHHFTFYGFMLCFAATCAATIYHYLLGLAAPYPLTSLPVVLGTLGGAGLLIGPAGLLWLNLSRHPLHGDADQKPMDRGFIALLLLSSLTGLALLALRDTSAMALLLALHLGVVLALFITLPYGKFAHGIYRSAALLKWSIEKRQPSRLQLGND